MPTHFSDSAKKNQSAVTSGTMHRSGLIYKSQPVQIYASRLHCGWIRMVRYVCWGQGPTRLISSSPFEEDSLGTTGRAYLTVAVKRETRRVVFKTSIRREGISVSCSKILGYSSSSFRVLICPAVRSEMIKSYLYQQAAHLSNASPKLLHMFAS